MTKEQRNAFRNLLDAWESRAAVIAYDDFSDGIATGFADCVDDLKELLKEYFEDW
jgi:hypothetical protein